MRVLGNDSRNELNEYKNLGVFKNYCNSFKTDVEENIEKTRKSAGMIFQRILTVERRVLSYTLSTRNQPVYRP